MNIKSFFKKKEVVNNTEDVNQKQQQEEDILNYYNTFNNQELASLRKKFAKINEVFKENNPQLFNNSEGNINFITQSLTDRMRDLYHSFNQNTTLQYLTYLISQESIVPINLYEYYIEMLLKNEILIKRIIEIPIHKTFCKFHIINNTYNDYKIPIQEIKQYVEHIMLDILYAIEQSEIYGGVYVVVSKNGIKTYQFSQLTNGLRFTDNKNPSGYSQIYIFNQMLKTRDFDLQWLKDNEMEYIDFMDGRRVPYNNLYLLTSTNKPKGVFMDKMLNGLNHSVLEGTSHHFIEIIQDLESLHKQLSIQNRVIFRVENYSGLTKIASARQMEAINRSIQQLTATKSSDGFVTDKENEVQLLNSNVSILEIIDYAVLKLSSFLFNIPLTWLTGETTTRYINTESAKGQQEATEVSANILILTYKTSINMIIKHLINNQNLTKKHQETGAQEQLQSKDYEIIF